MKLKKSVLYVCVYAFLLLHWYRTSRKLDRNKYNEEKIIIEHDRRTRSKLDRLIYTRHFLVRCELLTDQPFLDNERFVCPARPVPTKSSSAN